MKRKFLLLKLIFIFAPTFHWAAEISINNEGLTDGSLEILFLTDSTESAIGGFQFTLTGITITGALGGAAAENGFTVSSSSSTVLGFSFSGDVIPGGMGTLTLVSFSPLDDLTEICLTEIVLSDPSGTSMDVLEGNCVQIDCNGDLGGTVQLDCEDVCGGMAIEDCNGSCNGDAVIDDCEVCDGNNGDMDCNGDCFGNAELDCEAVCNGTAMEDCAAECNGDSVIDNCGDCDNDPANDCVEDCAGDWGGSAYEDNCGTCDDNSENDCVEDCVGEWGGGAVEDCAGVCEGSSEIDDCEECGGSSYFGGDGLLQDGSCDCNGNVLDLCGICGGTAETLEDCVEGYGLFIQNVDQLAGTLDIAYAAEGPVNGFQFDLTDVSITGASGGISEETAFTISNSMNTVIGFSLQGNSIIPGSGLLIEVTFVPPGDGDLLCFENIILSDPDGNSLEVEAGPCVELLIMDCNGALGGGAVLDECGDCEGIYFGCDSPGACPCSGCTDPLAENYDLEATIDDGTCTYPDFSGLIVINEIHYNPPGNSDQNDEFIEIINTLDLDVPLSGWSLSCSNSNWTLDIEEAIIDSAGYLIFANNDDTYPGSIEWPAGNLNNTTATITLVDNIGNTVDEVTYDDAWFGPGGPDDNGGFSLELIAPDLDNSDSGNWYTSFIEGGTPGEENSEIIYGCTDDEACNYDNEANMDDGSCEGPEENHDCDGNCLVDVDCLGVCGGTVEFDCADICDGTTQIDDCGDCGGVDYFDDNGLLPNGSCDCEGNVPDICDVCGGMADEQEDCVEGLTLSIDNVDQVDGSLDVKYASEFLLSGFQFNLPGVVITGVSGGAAEEMLFTVNFSANTVLGFSLEGNALPNGLGLMTTVHFEPPGYGAEVCLDQIVLSNPDGDALEYTAGPCVPLFEYDCNGELGGDAEFDECGICDGPGPEVECFEGSMVCEDSDCPLGGAVSFGSQSVNILEVMINNNTDIAGFEFDIEGADVISVYGGLAEAYGFTLNTANGIVLGFSFEGNVIPASEGDEVLVYLQLGGPETATVCFEEGSLVLSGPGGEGLLGVSGECTDVVLEIESGSLVSDFNLGEAFPNPFNAQTTIQFSIPDYEWVDISIIDIHGQTVKTLEVGYLNQGMYKLSWDADPFSSGVYFIAMRVGNFFETRKIILVK